MSKIFKDVLVAAGLAMGTIWLFNHWFYPTKTETHAMQVTPRDFIAAENDVQWNMVQPLKEDINFIVDKRGLPEHTSIATQWADLVFSTNGATLQSLVIKRVDAVKSSTIKTVFGSGMDEQYGTFFLVAFDKKAPVSYTLVDHHVNDGVHTLTYKAPSDYGEIYKTFVVYDDRHKIDVTVRVEVIKALEYVDRVRLFFDSPIMPSIGNSDVISGVLVDNGGTFVKKARNRLQSQQGWMHPMLFGGENRYMVHAMVEDSSHFVSRAYFGTAKADRITVMLEGPALVTGTNEWTMSFYMGPKEDASLALVDTRLEKTLDHSGIFAPISRLFLMILKWLYSYLHNYGLAIIVLTILLRLLMLPLAWYNRKNEKIQKEFRKKLAQLQYRYKNDPAGLQREREQLIRTYGMPGLGAGLLQMVIQMPPFFALSRLLSGSIELYHSGMAWIPDLSVSDPYYILPLLVFVAMAVHAFTIDGEQRNTFFVVCLVATAVAANVSAGLALYIAVTSIMGALQQLFERYMRRA